MDVFLSKLSSHATNYVIRSCIAVTSTYVMQQGSRLLKAVGDDPVKVELSLLQRRLNRKIQLISPILEFIENHYNKGNSALEAVVQTAIELREDIDAVGKRLEDAAHAQENATASPQQRRAELVSILADMKQLVLSIDDSIPLINLWVSAIGGIQTQASTFSPSRLLQASTLVNVGDMQFVISPSRPMQIGPNFVLSLYMLFRGHASAEHEQYGIEDGQRKPIWQEVVHKARVRLYRVPPMVQHTKHSDSDMGAMPMPYLYQLQIVEDLDDGRVHTFEDGNLEPGSYNGVEMAGIREFVPVGQISRMFYADVGRILNIHNEEGAPSNPILLLKRDTNSEPPPQDPITTEPSQTQEKLLEANSTPSVTSDSTLPEESPQDEIDRQIRGESGSAEDLQQLTEASGSFKAATSSPWQLPHNLDPEWLALEVFEFDDSASSTDGDNNESLLDGEDTIGNSRQHRLEAVLRNSVDNNLVAQMQRMRLASRSPQPTSTRSSCSEFRTKEDASFSKHITTTRKPTEALSRTTIERSPFGAIKTSLSLLEMLLRLTSLQEFEQTTHLASSDQVLRFYLEQSASDSGLQGKDHMVAKAEVERKIGFDPYSNGPSG